MARKRLAKWYAAANERRHELIEKWLGGPLTQEERAELDSLQWRCIAEAERVNPTPPLPDDGRFASSILGRVGGKRNSPEA